MSEISKSIQVICDEKGLEYDAVIDALETALGAAFRKDFGNRQGNYKVKFDVETGDIQVWDVKEVVEDIEEELLEKAQEALSELREKARDEGRDLSDEEIDGIAQFNPKTQIMLAEAKEVKKRAKVGDVLEMEQDVPGEFGRMAAQTAKQVIIQKLREAERNSVYEDFKDREGDIVQGIVQRRDRGGAVIIDLGKITGIVPNAEQVRRDRYQPGVRMQFYVASVDMGARGPEIILSRSSNKMVEAVFAQEIPEVEEGSVEIKAIARDPGGRSKVAVATEDDTIDPIGACIGQRGSRITTIIDELGGEKIDVIQWDDDDKRFIMNALSPAKIDFVDLDEEEKEATVTVAGDQFSLAIGRGGQNVRLAAELTGWRIKVAQDGEEVLEVSSEEGIEDVERKTGETVGEESKKEEVGSADEEEKEEVEAKEKEEVVVEDKKEE
ncbi:MAG: transcription termination factor NusA [Candidatus Magasanikbacteria bacterium]